MNVASLELCKELYELSGWVETDMFYGDTKGAEPVLEWGSMLLSKDFPAYDLGYLLRKLPKSLRFPEELSMTILKDEVHFMYPNGYDGGSKYVGKAPYPNFEDAACKLAIELFQQEVLDRG